MAGIGKTIDELPSFTSTPSLSSFFAIRDMSVAASSEEATKKYTIADLITLIYDVSTGMVIGRQALVANTPTTITFATAFISVPEVGILRVIDSDGVQIGGVVDISNITETDFVATAIQDCTLTYLAGIAV